MTTTTPTRTGRAVTVYTALARIVRTLRNDNHTFYYRAVLA